MLPKKAIPAPKPSASTATTGSDNSSFDCCLKLWANGAYETYESSRAPKASDEGFERHPSQRPPRIAAQCETPRRGAGRISSVTVVADDGETGVTISREIIMDGRWSGGAARAGEGFNGWMNRFGQKIGEGPSSLISTGERRLRYRRCGRGFLNLLLRANRDIKEDWALAVVGDARTKRSAQQRAVL